MKNKEEKATTSNSTVYDRLSRFDLRCSFCKPNKGENKKSYKKHGCKSPKYKDKHK